MIPKKTGVLYNFLLSKDFMHLTFLAGVLIVFFHAQVLGAIVFLLLISLLLVICDDVLATTMPFLIACVFLSTMYDSYDTFIKLWWMAIPVVGSLVFHFVYYRQPISVGESFYGNAAVAIAVTLGGIGMIPLRQYFNGVALYYVVFLGVGMVGAYLLIRSQIGTYREYDVAERIAYNLYMMGLFACFVVLFLYAERMDIFLQNLEALELPSRNNYATFLMFALPMPFYYAIERKHHLIAGFFLYFCIILTGSRGGLLCGAAELVLCFVYLTYIDKENRKFNFTMLCGLLLVGVMAQPIVHAFYESRSYDGDFFNDLGGRIKMAQRAIQYLKENPVFGSGLGYIGNADIYQPKTGALMWYHSLPFQIIGSMGLVGIAAYAYQFGIRVLLVFRGREALRLCFGVVYFGIFAMSCVNPGEFCPLPYELLLVILFLLLEQNGKKL